MDLTRYKALRKIRATTTEEAANLRLAKREAITPTITELKEGVRAIGAAKVRVRTIGAKRGRTPRNYF